MMECRSCSSHLERPFMDFGELPLPNSFVALDHQEPVKKYPLEVYYCEHCHLVQIKNLVAPEEIFNEDYKYFSSYSQDLLETSKNLCHKVIDKFHLNQESRVVEIASNDGYLLNFFKEAGLENILGVEPTLSTATKAIEKGIPTEICFFNDDTARRLAETEKADIIIANNVIAHVPDIQGFAKGLHTLIDDEGTVILEFQYVLDLIRERLFDLIYYEHFSYFSLESIGGLLRDNGLSLVHVEKTDSQGGSLRVYAKKTQNVTQVDPSVETILEEEKTYGLNRYQVYEDFARDVEGIKKDALKRLEEMKEDGVVMGAYGASCKGSVFLNYLGLKKDTLHYIIDKNINKQNMLLYGTDIPVYGPDKLKEHPVDRLLILSWNLKDEISGEYPDESFFVMMPYDLERL